jgi:hypothetical protein
MQQGRMSMKLLVHLDSMSRRVKQSCLVATSTTALQGQVATPHANPKQQHTPLLADDSHTPKK